MAKGDSGGWASKSECGPEMPKDFGGDADHGAQRLASLIKNFSPTGSGGEFLGAEDYNVDRKNGEGVNTNVPDRDHGTFAKDSK